MNDSASQLRLVRYHRGGVVEEELKKPFRAATSTKNKSTAAGRQGKAARRKPKGKTPLIMPGVQEDNRFVSCKCKKVKKGRTFINDADYPPTLKVGTWINSAAETPNVVIARLDEDRIIQAEVAAWDAGGNDRPLQYSTLLTYCTVQLCSIRTRHRQVSFWEPYASMPEWWSKDNLITDYLTRSR